MPSASGSPIVSPIWISSRPQSFPISPAETDGALDSRPAVEDADRRHLRFLVLFEAIAAEAQPVAHVDRPREQADVRDLLAGRTAFDLEDGRRDGAVGVARGGRQQLGDACRQCIDARAGDRRAEEDRMHERPLRLRGELVAQSAATRRLSRPRRRQQATRRRARRARRSAAALKSLSSSAWAVATAARVPSRVTDPSAIAAGVSRSEMPFSTRSLSAPRRSILFTNMSVGMRSRWSARINRRVCGCTPSTAEIDQHGAVEHAQHPLHLGDEVRVAGRVDQVDRDVVDRERHDGGLDRDAALPFQRQEVGLGRAVIDAAELVDDTGRVEQPLGESCLTGVYMRHDPQVQRSAKQASYPPNRSQSPSRWT